MRYFKLILQKKELYLPHLSFIALFFSFYYKIILNINRYLFTDTGDGMKNYFTYAYYIKNNKSWINFEGLNYPYGEHIFYTDSTPFLSVLIKIISSVFPSITNYSIGILNGFILSSFYFCFVYLIKIFRLLNLSNLSSTVSALCITFLSPQIFRLTGHLALGTAFFIPLIIYLTLQSLKRSNVLKSNITLVIAILFLLTIHAYLGFIAFCVSWVIFFLHYSLKPTIKSTKSFLLTSLFLVSPLLIFNLFIYITDTHSGRTTNPFGFFHYYGDWRSFLLPIQGGLTKILSSLFSFENRNWEANNYLGIITILSFPLILFYLIKSKIKNFESKFVLSLLISGIIFGLYSMCIPFKNGHEKWVDTFSILKQFRALGRFGWITYFTLSIAAFYVLLSKIETLKNSTLKMTLPFILIFISLFESFTYHTSIASNITQTSNLFNEEIFKKESTNLNTNKLNQSFQAIIPSPFYFIGTENHEISIVDLQIVTWSMTYSYHCKLPLMSNYLSRSSIKEGHKTMQFFGPSYYKKALTLDLKSRKNFVLLSLNNTPSNLDSSFTFNKKLIYQNKIIQLKKLSYRKITKPNNNLYFSHFINSSLNTKPQNSTSFIFEDFDEKKTTVKKHGNGSFEGKMNTYEILKEISSKKLKNNTTYDVSFWVYHGGKNFGQDQFCQQTFVQSNKDGKVDWLTDIHSAKSSFIKDGLWTKVTFDFTTNNTETNYQIISYGDPSLLTTYIIDDLAIIEKGKSFIFKWNKNELFHNNNCYRRD